MQDARLEQLFERFRRHGDVPALGQVFDETAGELLRVAMGLVREPGEADDLLQETFLTAIERAGRYESGRRLVPWLLGILVHHARERRRVARRGLDAARLERGEPERPEQRLLGAEVEQEVERALGELSSRERVVLEAYLKHGKGAAEIALELGGSPGAVRMQIHRGLDRLRKALPVGLALGAAGGALSAQGLGGVRAAVLRAGQTAAESLVLGAGSAAGGLGTKLGTAGVLVGKKSIVAAVVAAALLALFFTWRGLEKRGEAARASDVARVETSTRASQPLKLETPPEQATSVRSERLELASSLGSAANLDPLTGGLRGRLVEADGTPVAGLPVALLELEEDAVLGNLLSASASVLPRIFLADTVSGADGRFALPGARTSGALQALGLDLGGARPSVRVVDAALEPGQWTELGDLVLAATGALRGRVVDERGQPVADARVRVGVLTDFVRQMGLHELMAEGAAGEVRESEASEVGPGDDGGVLSLELFELPEWLGRVEERLPFVTTRTDSDGRFELPRAPAERVTVLLDRPGRMTVAATTANVEAGGARDLGALVLDAGRTLAGRILDAAGQPVAGAEVRGGRGDRRGGVALFAPVQRADEAGRFRLTGITSAGEAMVLARRDGNSAWTPFFGEGEELELRLAVEPALELEVVDREGVALPAVDFELRCGREAAMLGAFSGAPRRVEAQALGAGRWTLGPRAQGNYLVGVRAPGHAARAVPVVHGAGAGARTRVVLEPERTAEVLVVDAASGEPLAQADVSILLVNSRRGLLASARTDGEGRARLEVPDVESGEPGSGVLMVRAAHARFAPRAQAFALSAQATTIRLGPGGKVIARADPRQLAGKRTMLLLEYRGAPPHHELHFPMLSAFDEEGVSTRARLPAGTWRWSVVEALSTREALSWLSDERAPRELASGGFELAEGETLELAVGPSSAPPVPRGEGTGVVHGTVLVNGDVPEGVRVYLSPLTAGTEFAPAELALEDETFRFEGVPAGGYYLAVARQQARTGGFQQLGVQQFTLAEGEVRAFELAFETFEVLVRVRGEDGTPAADAQLTLFQVGGQGGGSFGSADKRGELRLSVNGSGKFQFTAIHAEFGAAQREVELAGERDETLEIVLERGVPCAGTARLAPGMAQPTEPVYVTVRPAAGLTASAQTHLTFENGTASFTFVGLKPGQHLVSAMIGNEWKPEFSFELPEWGSTTLEWTLGLPPPDPPR